MRAAGLGAVVLAVGVFLGMQLQVRRSSGPAAAPPFLLQGVLDDVGLEPDQQRTVDEILDHHQRKIQGAMGELTHLLDAQTDSVRKEVRGVLSSDQLERFDSLLSVREAELRSRVRRRRPGPDPGPLNQ